MNKNITATVEKENEFGLLLSDSIRLIKIGGGIANTITIRPGYENVQHCNLVLEITENDLCSSSEFARTRNDNNF